MNTCDHSQGKADWLVSCGLLAAELAEQAILSAARLEQPMVKYLVDQHILDPRAIASIASNTFALPLLDLDALDLATMPTAAVDLKLIKKHHVLPVCKQGNRLYLAVSDPANETALEDIKFHTGCKTELLIVEEHKLNAAIQTLADSPAGEAQAPIDFATSAVDAQEDFTQSELATDEATPVMPLVNKILMDGLRHKVSDIHIETYENTARIRFREDGLLREIAQPPVAITRKIISRLKVMAKLDIAEKRLPQDGRIKLKLSRESAIDFRVSTLPTLWGEKTVIRVLDPETRELDLGSLGFPEVQKQHYRQALERQQGLVLVTGPTGSGKTLSLYAGLKTLNTQERNIATAEDPVEIYMQGINQVAINTAVGLTFAETLRAFLRQDPDVLMVGEIRDLETAEIAIQASQTGHLVLSTLHTNSACETITRLMDMGISNYHIATSLSLVIAQRLVRRLCNRCKKTLEIPDKVLLQEGYRSQQLENIRLFVPGSCEYCHNGFRGRLGIYETLPITAALSRVIMEGGNSMQVADIARQTGFNTLRDSALELAAQGLTSLAEINRVIL